MITTKTTICEPLLYSLLTHLSGQRCKLSETHFIIQPTEEPWKESCTVISEIPLHESFEFRPYEPYCSGITD